MTVAAEVVVVVLVVFLAMVAVVLRVGVCCRCTHHLHIVNFAFEFYFKHECRLVLFVLPSFYVTIGLADPRGYC